MARARQFLDKQAVSQTVYDLAKERVATIFDFHDHVCVAFSGGKDSTVVLNLCADEARRRGRVPLDVVFIDEEAVPPETIEYVERVAARDDVSLRWYCIPVRHVNGCSRHSPWWYPWDPDCPEKWCRPVPPQGITELAGFTTSPPLARLQTIDVAGLFFDPAVHGSTAWVMGIRADESMTRLRAVTRRKEDNWIIRDPAATNPGNVNKVYPIYDFRTSDCWTFARMAGDWNRAYDLQELHGFHGSRQRIAPPYGAEPMQMLGMYKTCWPDLWEKMVDRVPGAATAARYSRTELYSFRGRPKPADDETWKDLIVRLLERHEDEDVRARVRTRIADEIRWHYSKVGNRARNPIVPTAPHPVTGMSLEFLAMIAMRADLKKRKVAGWELGEDSPENRRRVAAAYREQAEQAMRGDIEHI